MTYVYKKVGRRLTTEHVAIAERVLGRRLREGECVHHVDHNGLNNSHDNLVICPSAAYHKLLHIRTEAYDACGNAEHRKCRFCKQFDSKNNMINTYRTAINRSWDSGWAHETCLQQANRQYRMKSKHKQAPK